MRDRYRSMVATIATGAMLACGDAAVGDVTAPPLAATPAPPVTNTWPTVSEVTDAGIPNAIGIQITLSPRFENNNTEFVVDARVQFQWANDVSASVKAWVINTGGATLNSGSAGMQYSRWGLPVPSGDTTFTVKVSTNGFTCDLTGKSSGEGKASTVALDTRLVAITLWQQTVLPTSGPDVSQPKCGDEIPSGCEGPATRVVAGATGILRTEVADCDDAPAPPGGSGGDTVEVCYTIWREYWFYDFYQRQYVLYAVVPIGTYCETVAT